MRTLRLTEREVERLISLTRISLDELGEMGLDRECWQTRELLKKLYAAARCREECEPPTLTITGKRGA